LSPGSSQTLDGYVFGVSYAIVHHLQILVGYALSPVNQAIPGFQTAASQFVAQEHGSGRALAFDPNAMASNS
jgi:hypothetical protein